MIKIISIKKRIWIKINPIQMQTLKKKMANKKSLQDIIEFRLNLLFIYLFVIFLIYQYINNQHNKNFKN